MKALRITAIILAIMSLLTIGTFAIDFVESIYRKDGPEFVGGDTGGDKLLITPVSALHNNSVTIHEDIKNSLIEADKQLGQSEEWQNLIPDFIDHWRTYTIGAPAKNAIVSDIFDVRFLSELDTADDGKNIELKVRVQGITQKDLFMIVVKENSSDQWVVADFNIDYDDIITIKANTKSAFAIVRDSGALPTITPDAPNSPLTGVDAKFPTMPIIAALLGGAAVCLAAAAKRRAM